MAPNSDNQSLKKDNSGRFNAYNNHILKRRTSYLWVCFYELNKSLKFFNFLFLHLSTEILQMDVQFAQSIGDLDRSTPSAIGETANSNDFSGASPASDARVSPSSSPGHSQTLKYSIPKAVFRKILQSQNSRRSTPYVVRSRLPSSSIRLPNGIVVTDHHHIHHHYHYHHDERSDANKPIDSQMAYIVASAAAVRPPSTCKEDNILFNTSSSFRSLAHGPSGTAATHAVFVDMIDRDKKYLQTTASSGFSTSSSSGSSSSNSDSSVVGLSHNLRNALKRLNNQRRIAIESEKRVMSKIMSTSSSNYLDNSADTAAAASQFQYVVVSPMMNTL